MKNRIWIAVLTMAFFATSAFAADGAESSGPNWLLRLFFAFLAAVIVFQLIPALVLFGSMLAAIFKRKPEKANMLESEQTKGS